MASATAALLLGMQALPSLITLAAFVMVLVRERGFDIRIHGDHIGQCLSCFATLNTDSSIHPLFLMCCDRASYQAPRLTAPPTLKLRSLILKEVEAWGVQQVKDTIRMYVFRSLTTHTRSLFPPSLLRSGHPRPV